MSSVIRRTPAKSTMLTLRTGLLSFAYLAGTIGVVFVSPSVVQGAGSFAAPTLTAADYHETVTTGEFASWTHFSTELVFDPQNNSEIENTDFCPTEPSFCIFSLSRAKRSHLSVSLRSVPDIQAIRNFIDGLSIRVRQEPVDAKFSVGEDGKVTVAEPEKTGRDLDTDKSVAILFQAVGQSLPSGTDINLPAQTTTPHVTAADQRRLGLVELVGEGHTDFRGSPKNRLYNIKRSLEQFQGVLIAPDEEFSFVDHLGPVDGEHGYLPELVIKNNRTEPEFGGGICQVSSTVFRAAIYSGMKITARRNHAYPVRYYTPYGMDATVYVPRPDLRFINNTPGTILMISNIEGTTLSFRFYGTKDGRTITIDGPHILESNPDGSMKTIFNQTVTDTNGAAFINDNFWSNYKSPSLFPHPGDVPLKSKPDGWTAKQWRDYQRIHPS